MESCACVVSAHVPVMQGFAESSLGLGDMAEKSDLNVFFFCFFFTCRQFTRDLLNKLSCTIKAQIQGLSDSNNLMNSRCVKLS